MINEYEHDFLSHHGVKSQKWGRRQYQNHDGSLTALGRIHYGVGEARKGASKVAEETRKYASKLGDSMSEAGVNIKKNYNNIKIDALDYANRKGVLDFLDSKADDPFEAVRTSLSNRTESEKAKVDNFMKDFMSESYGDVDTALRKINRYSTAVASMRKNEPFVKVEDTSKPWMETFKDGMMGWNHIDKIENQVRDKAVDKYTKFLNSDSNKGRTLLDVYGNINTSDIVGKYVRGERNETPNGSKRVTVTAHDSPGDRETPEIINGFYGTTTAKTSMRKINQNDVDSAIKSAGAKYIQALSKEGHLVKMGWDKPMDIETVDGLRINAVVYKNGGGVQGNISKSLSDQISQQAKEVQDFISETGRLPTTVANKSYAKPNPANINTNHFMYLYRDDLVDWALKHSDFLEHHGTKGQKWGRRQYQNHDGSLTALGRIHYGVGEARKGAKKGAKKVAKKVAEGTKDVTGKLGGAAASEAKKLGSAVRKTVAPTNADLAEKYQKAVDANNRKQLIAATKELQGKKKKLKDMTDQEVMDRFNRLQKEAAIRAMEKEAKKGPVRKFIEENAKAGFNRAMNATIEQAVKNLFAEEKPVKYSDLLNERKAQLGLEVLDGNEKVSVEAAQKLKDLNSANAKPKGGDSGGKKNQSDNRDNGSESKKSGSSSGSSSGSTSSGSSSGSTSSGSSSGSTSSGSTSSESKKSGSTSSGSKSSGSTSSGSKKSGSTAREKTQAWYKEPPEKAKVIKTRIIR